MKTLLNLLPWAVFVPTLLLANQVEPGLAYILGMVAGGVANQCGNMLRRFSA